MNMDENPDNMDFGDFSDYDEAEEVVDDIYPDEDSKSFLNPPLF